MSENSFKEGDKIFHKSNPSIAWIIEKIEGNDAVCSTVISETLEYKKHKFSIMSIEKCATNTVIVGGRKKRNNYY